MARGTAIEVQVRRYGAWHKRGLFYLTRTLGSQLSAGEGYQELRASVGLHLLDFDLFTDTAAEREQAVWRFESAMNASRIFRWGTFCK
mgnify:FL=1|tara:strand:- start:923 stop:1186 length:264 start_codon:yes stop_codon:yes gene_type:complete